MKRLLGLDIDDTLIDFNRAFCEYHNNLYGTALKRSDILRHDLEYVLGCSKAVLVERVIDFYNSRGHQEIRPIPGAYEVLSSVREHCDFFLITARPQDALVRTLNLLDGHFPMFFKKFNFTGSFCRNGVRSKAESAKQLGIEVMIDDSFESALDMSRLGIPVVLLDAPWNQGPTPRNVTRVSDWKDVPTAAHGLGFPLLPPKLSGDHLA